MESQYKVMRASAKLGQADTLEEIVFGEQRVTIEDVVAIANGVSGAVLDADGVLSRRTRAGTQFMERLLEEDGVIYGVTTGFGDSCTVTVPLDRINELSRRLIEFHTVGMGAMFSRQEGRAILVARLSSLSQGYSGVSWELLELLTTLISQDIVPVIPQEGSVGASGDLTPLSYVVGVLIGERDVYFQGGTRPAKEVLEQLGIKPIELQPKEGLAVMNGTSVMTGLACLVWSRAEYLTRLCSRITAMCSLGLQGNSNHFDDLLFELKPHPGQSEIARWIQQDLNHQSHPRNSPRLQDRYSIRCAPHVIGVLRDSLPWMRSMIETELNSVNDNPIIDGEGEHIFHGGHFYGGHIALVMDTMKNCVANLADLMEKQLALLVDVKFSNGLPSNLSGASADDRMLNHGFKAVQIAVSAWTAEALKNTMPASVFSRSTECHNQDKVSMGTIAARDCMRVLELTEQAAAAMLISAGQALELRLRCGELDRVSLSNSVLCTLDEVFAEFEFITNDRALDKDLRNFVKLIQEQHWSTY